MLASIIAIWFFSRTVALGGTVATVGFPDIGLQAFALQFSRQSGRLFYFLDSEVRPAKFAPAAEAILRVHFIPPVAGGNHPRFARGQ
jgi:hypothetical protein